MSQIKDLSRLLLTTICGLPHAYSYCRGVSPHQNITSAEILFEDIVSFELTPSLARRSSGFAINKCWLRDIMWPNNKRKWPKTARQWQIEPNGMWASYFISFFTSTWFAWNGAWMDGWIGRMADGTNWKIAASLLRKEEKQRVNVKRKENGSAAAVEHHLHMQM